MKRMHHNFANIFSNFHIAEIQLEKPDRWHNECLYIRRLKAVHEYHESPNVIVESA